VHDRPPFPLGLHAASCRERVVHALVEGVTHIVGGYYATISLATGFCSGQVVVMIVPEGAQSRRSARVNGSGSFDGLRAFPLAFDGAAYDFDNLILTLANIPLLA